MRGRDGIGVRVRCRSLASREGNIYTYIYIYLERRHLLDEVVRGLVDLLHRVGRNLQRCGDGEVRSSAQVDPLDITLASQALPLLSPPEAPQAAVRELPRAVR